MKYMNYFYVPYSPVATYMNIMQDKIISATEYWLLRNVWIYDKTLHLFIVTDTCAINVEENEDVERQSR